MKGVRLLWTGIVSTSLVLGLLGCQGRLGERVNPRPIPSQLQKRLLVFVGTASKPAMEEAKKAFEAANSDVKLDINYAGSGTLLNQMTLEKTGDVYVPGSDDFMDRAQKQGAIRPETRQIICWLVPAIVVPKGNPKKIQRLEDLARPGVRVGLAKAGAVCLGDISEEILTAAGLVEKVKKNVVTYALSCEETAHLVELGEVDAIIGWEVFSSWAPEKIEAIPLPANLAARARNIAAAVSAFSRQPARAQELVDFLASSPQSKEIFQHHGYALEKPGAK